MFDLEPKARANLKPGTIYAVEGESAWIYYGQVAPDKSIGFFRRRDRETATITDVLAAPIMAVIDVAHPSITRALRAGIWKKLGRADLAETLTHERLTVQWPIGTLDVTLCSNGSATRETVIHDPAIQNLERVAVWDAAQHIPQRLTADFGAEAAAWHIGGPIWRERMVKEEFARRFPNAPWHALPKAWVSPKSWTPAQGRGDGMDAGNDEAQ